MCIEDDLSRTVDQLTCSIVVGIEHGKQCADDKNVCVLFENHFGGSMRECSSVSMSMVDALKVSSYCLSESRGKRKEGEEEVVLYISLESYLRS